ncbi:WXG100 family type VII secretion target [Nocardia sp. NPDC051833]|uniref:WXG100 family type VII secretion target n=1 Tax=Nocardia sp. NPDC051833 TaxID=3155674 RepID=UPI0034496CD2
MSTSGGTSNPGDGLSVVSDQVSGLGQYLSDLVQTLRSAVDTAGREVDGLADSWTGTAANSFSDEWAAVYDGGTRLLNSLAALAGSLGVTVDSYQRRDNDNAAELGTASLNL